MMFHFLKKIFQPDTSLIIAKTRYAALVEKSRAAFLYQDCGIPDSLDGRYEAIVLHLFIAERTLPENSESMQLLRHMHEAFFDDMDRGLREGGVGDTGIGKRIKRMAAGLYGRLQSYRECINDDAQLKEALIRNVYATCDSPPASEKIDTLIQYIHAEIAAI